MEKYKETNSTQREGRRERSSNYWLILQIALMAGTDAGVTQEPGTPSMSPTWVGDRNPNHWIIFY